MSKPSGNEPRLQVAVLQHHPLGARLVVPGGTAVHGTPLPRYTRGTAQASLSLSRAVWGGGGTRTPGGSYIPPAVAYLSQCTQAVRGSGRTLVPPYIIGSVSLAHGGQGDSLVPPVIPIRAEASVSRTGTKAWSLLDTGSVSAPLQDKTTSDAGRVSHSLSSVDEKTTRVREAPPGRKHVRRRPRPGAPRAPRAPGSPGSPRAPRAPWRRRRRRRR